MRSVAATDDFAISTRTPPLRTTLVVHSPPMKASEPGATTVFGLLT